MGAILKFVAYSFLILLVLVLAIPLLWLVIKLIVWLFGGAFFFIGESIGGILLILVCLGLIIWMVSNW